MGIKNLQNLKVKVVDDIRIRMVRMPMYTYLRVRVCIYDRVFDITSICIILVRVHIHYRYVLVLYE